MHKFIAAILTAILLLGPRPVYAQDPTPRPEYVVQEGDSLYSIALRFNLTVDELIDANTLVNPDNLGIGDRLAIPGLEGVSGILTSQVVPYGENLTSITRQNQISEAMVIKLNHLTSPAEVYAGANLIIPENDTAHPSFSRAVLPSGLTFLELSAIQGSDPWTALNANQLVHSWQALPLQSYFFPTTEENSSGTGIHPSLESVIVRGMPLAQGRTLEVEIQSREPLFLDGTWNGKPFQFFSEEENHYFALQGIHAMLAPGIYPLSIHGKLGDGSEFNFEQMVAVLQNYNFLGNRGDQPEKLSVDQSGLDPSLNDPENQLVLNLVTPANPQRAWNGLFTVPGYNRDWLTSRFGNRRLYNNDPKIYFHTGLDFEGGTGLAIKAAAPGVVVLAGPLTVRGNATFIDHGWGVYTAYFHQSEIKVKVGDRVEAGQEIGLVGATGLRVTGAHLHWEIWVNGVQVDPLEWLDNVYP